MAKNKFGGHPPATIAISATPMKVRALLDAMEAEANGEEWETDPCNPLMGVGFGASPEAKRFMLLGYYSEQIRILDQKLAQMKQGKGRPKANITIDIKRAAAVLGADDLYRDTTGSGALTQKAAIDLAAQIDKILCDNGKRGKPLFGQMTTMKRWQDSVSKGLRELGIEGERFLKK